MRWCLPIMFTACVTAVPTSQETKGLAGSMRITVYEYSPPSGSPTLPGAKVLFIAPDQTTQTVYTDANGVAEAVSPPNTTIVVYQTAERPTSPLIKSFAGVNPGADIIAGRHWSYPTADLGDLTFHVHKDRASDRFQLQVSCGTVYQYPGSDTILVHVRDCPQASNATAIAWGMNGGGAFSTGVSILSGLDLHKLVNKTVHMPPYDHNLATVTGAFANIPAGVTDLGWGCAYGVRGDRSTFVGVNAGAVPGPANTISMLDFGDYTFNSVNYTAPSYSHLSYSQAEASRSTHFDFDASLMLHPARGAVFDSASNAISWTEGASGRAGTVTNVGISISDVLGKSVLINLHGPSTSTSLAMPPLDPGVAPAPGDRLSISGGLLTLDGLDFDQTIDSVDDGAISPGNDPAWVGRVWTSAIN